MRLVVLLLIPILCHCWQECIYTECKPFWDNQCSPTDHFPDHGGNTEWCAGFFWIRHECCRTRKYQIEPWRHVEQPAELSDYKRGEEME